MKWKILQIEGYEEIKNMTLSLSYLPSNKIKEFSGIIRIKILRARSEQSKLNELWVYLEERWLKLCEILGTFKNPVA